MVCSHHSYFGTDDCSALVGQEMIFTKEVTVLLIVIHMVCTLMMWDVRTRASGNTGVAIYLLMASNVFYALRLILSLFE